MPSLIWDVVWRFLRNKTRERNPQGMRLQWLLSIVPTSTRYHDNLNIELFLCPSKSRGIGWRLGPLTYKEFRICDSALFADVTIYRFKLIIFRSDFQEEKIKKCESTFYLVAAQCKPFSKFAGGKLKSLKREWQILRYINRISLLHSKVMGCLKFVIKELSYTVL
jgi:hypothetical protein